jgi:uncharacterized protein with NRDE domain
MCTVLIIHRVHPDLPLVVAANRDEAYARPASGPVVLDEAHGIVGGRDLTQGGTWMGVTRGGLWVGLTNQRPRGVARALGADEDLGLLPVSAPRSRGQLVLEVLRQGSQANAIDAIGAHLETLDPRLYLPCNLAYGDGRELEVAYVRPGGVERVRLPPGVHVLANDRLGSPEFPKAPRLAARAEPHLTRPWPELSVALAGLLADHHLPGLDEVPAPPPGSAFDHALLQQLQALCIHTPAYGTRSATLAALVPGRIVDYCMADGPPCRTAFASYLHLLAQDQARVAS